jgi:hypothetical protein
MFQVHTCNILNLSSVYEYRIGAIILLSKKNCGIPYSVLASLVQLFRQTTYLKVQRNHRFH